MGKLAIILWTALFFGCLYAIATLVIFFKLKSRLKDADLDIFKNELGKNYLYKQQLNGCTKYKWMFGVMTVRLTCDESGKPVEYEIRPAPFLPVLFRKKFSTEL